MRMTETWSREDGLQVFFFADCPIDIVSVFETFLNHIHKINGIFYFFSTFPFDKGIDSFIRPEKKHHFLIIAI